MIHNTPLISMIVAVGENREMGKDNDLPWGRELPTDMKRFRDKTRGHAVIMGKRTFESMQSNPLPNRVNIVVSRNPSVDDISIYHAKNVIVCDSIEKAIEEAKKSEREEIFIIGGGKIFELSMKLADKLYLTLVHAKFPDADVFFPDYSDFKKVVYREEVSENGFNYEFLDLVR
ncbi:MAG: dihydrofolate reductase [Candidatus Levyibacteriota bacterium]